MILPTRSSVSTDGEQRPPRRLSQQQLEKVLDSTLPKRSLTGSFPSPPLHTPLPPTPKRPLSAISLQDVSSLPRLNLNLLETERTESPGIQLPEVTASVVSSPVSSVATTHTAGAPSNKPPSLSLRESFYSLPQTSPSQPQPSEVPQARPKTAPASPPDSQASSRATSYRTSFSTTNSPLTPASPGVEKHVTPAPEDVTLSGKSFTSMSSHSSGKLPPDVSWCASSLEKQSHVLILCSPLQHPYIRRVAPVPFPPDQQQPAIRLQRAHSRSETGSDEDEELDQTKLFYQIPSEPVPNRSSNPSTTPKKLRRKSLSSRSHSHTALGMQPPPMLEKQSGNRLSKLLGGGRARAWSYAGSD